MLLRTKVFYSTLTASLLMSIHVYSSDNGREERTLVPRNTSQQLTEVNQQVLTTQFVRDTVRAATEGGTPEVITLRITPGRYFEQSTTNIDTGSTARTTDTRRSGNYGHHHQSGGGSIGGGINILGFNIGGHHRAGTTINSSHNSHNNSDHNHTQNQWNRRNQSGTLEVTLPDIELSVRYAAPNNINGTSLRQANTLSQPYTRQISQYEGSELTNTTASSSQVMTQQIDQISGQEDLELQQAISASLQSMNVRQTSHVQMTTTETEDEMIRLATYLSLRDHRDEREHY